MKIVEHFNFSYKKQEKKNQKFDRKNHKNSLRK